jgi:hypothetical protein
VKIHIRLRRLCTMAPVGMEDTFFYQTSCLPCHLGVKQ